MNSARRKAFGGAEPNAETHAGLLRDRCLRSHKEMPGAWDKTEPTTPEEDLLQRVIGIKSADAYKLAFARWQGIAGTRGWLTLGAVAAGPLAVGLGNASPLEIGLTIHHTYGMPVIPGSGIKGVLRRAAEQASLKRDAPEFVALFGDTKSGSGFTFWDAWYDPDSVGGQPFHRDVITVHHPRYYGSGGKDSSGKDIWPTDFDNPTPVPFLVVRPGARFLFAAECPSPEWADYVRHLLAWALENLGLGAKTNAGYGRFAVDGAANASAGSIVASEIGASGSAAPAVTSPATEEPERPVWQSAILSYDRGRGILVANSEAGRAESVRSATPDLFERMAPGLVALIRDKKKSGRADIVVQHLGGRSYRLIEILSEEGGA